MDQDSEEEEQREQNAGDPDGRLRKRYVRASDVALVKAGCQARRQQKQQMRILARDAWNRWREIKPQLLEVH